MRVAVLLAMPNQRAIFGYEGAISEALRPSGLQLITRHPGTQDVRLGSEYFISVPDRTTADRAVAILSEQPGVERVEIHD